MHWNTFFKCSCNFSFKMFSLNNLTTFLILFKITVFKYVPFDTMYTIPICIWSYKESDNSLNADICISSCEAITRSNPKTFPGPRWLPYSCMFVLAVIHTWMFQTLLEEESDVNGIVDLAKPWFWFIELVFSGTEQLLWEGEATSKS